MVVLLIGMSVMAILMTAAMPVWKQATQRDKEAELVFRGEQYVRAIGLFQKRAGPGVLPPNLDVLVQQRMLRKKFKDPITGKDFDLLSPTQAIPGGAPGGGPAPAAGRGAPPPAPSGIGTASTQAGAGRGTGGIMGVVSKSKDTSIRVYNGRTHYDEWQFMFTQQTQTPGAGGAPGQPQRGGRGQLPPGAPGVGGRGTPPQGGRGFTPVPTPFGGGSGRNAVPAPGPSRPPRN